MTLQRRISRLEEQHYLDTVARIAAALGVTVEEVLYEADRIVAAGIEAAEAQLMRDFGLTCEQLEAEKAACWRLVEHQHHPSHN